MGVFEDPQAGGQMQTKATVRAIGGGDAARKRILMLTTSGHLYEGAGGRVRIVSETRFLLQAGYDCSILCIVPARSLRSPQRLSRALESMRAESGARATAIPMWPGRRWAPRTSVFADSLLLKWFLKHTPADLIHAHGVGACLRALQARKGGWPKIICDFHGASREEYLYATSGQPVKRMLKTIEEAEMKSFFEAEGVVFVSRALQRYYEERFGRADRPSAIVPCATWVPELTYDQRRRKRQLMGVDDRFVFVYAGSYRRYQRLDRMCAVFQRAAEVMSNAYFLVLTNHATEFEQFLRSRPIDPRMCRVVSLPHADVAEWLAAGDCGLLLRDNAPINRVASPTKFAEYLAAGVPVLLEGTVGDYNELLDEMSVGIVVEQADLGDKTWSFCRRVQAEREQYWKKCRMTCQRLLSWDAAGRALLELYGTILSGRVEEC